VADGQKRSTRRREQVAPVEYHLLLLVTLGLVAFGLVMVYSASSGVAVLSNRDPLSVLAKQAVYAAIGVVAMLVCARVPYRQLRYAGPPVMFGVIVLLVLVLVPGIGAEINNARRWILIGPISIQPSEFAKAAVLIFSAAVLSGRKRPPRSLKQLFNPVGAVALLICALVVVEPDLGTAIAIAVMVCGLLLVAGTPLRLFVSIAAIFALAAGAMIMFEPYRLQRMTTFLDPRADASGAGWQIVQATLGLGNGGLTGVGLGNGTVKSFTPEASTDMIASVIGEELGLLGIVATVAGFAAFAVLGYRIAIRCRDSFGRYLAAGATSLIAGQAFVNLGAVLSMLPLTGVPLPLISVGGSSLVVMLALVGVMLNVANSESGAAAKAKPRRKSTDAKPKQQQQPAAAKPRPDRRRRHGGARRTGTGGGKRAAG
jgi:cell division protein FtsW